MLSTGMLPVLALSFLACTSAVSADETADVVAAPGAHADRWEVRREVREGVREIGREKREARWEVRREIRHDRHGLYDRHDRDRDDDVLKGVAVGAAVVGVTAAIVKSGKDD